MDLNDYYKVDGNLKQIRDLEKLIYGISAFERKFNSPIDLGLFYHMPTEIIIELHQVCKKMKNKFKEMIQTQRDEISNV